MGETNFIDGHIKTAGEKVTVDTALGVFTASLSPQRSIPRIGEPCTLSVRPESWRISANAPEVNAFPGRIRACTYLGEMAQYEFAAAGSALKIYELNPRFVDHAGDREMHASVSPDDVVVLPR
jgi:iron(III) transport system ATP-binding protein